MKYVFVALAASLSIMVLTRSRPILIPNADIDLCAGEFCSIRPDGFCTVHYSPCDPEVLNCKMIEKPWRHWYGFVDISECAFITALHQVAICTSSCPVADCYPDGLVCAANTFTYECFVVADICELKGLACENPEIYHADMDRCSHAGLYYPGDFGPC